MKFLQQEKNPAKERKALATYVELKGYEHGGSRNSSGKIDHLKNEPTTQKELAESYGVSQHTMNNYMRMVNMIPELEDLPANLLR